MCCCSFALASPVATAQSCVPAYRRQGLSRGINNNIQYNTAARQCLATISRQSPSYNTIAGNRLATIMVVGLVTRTLLIVTCTMIPGSFPVTTSFPSSSSPSFYNRSTWQNRMATPIWCMRHLTIHVCMAVWHGTRPDLIFEQHLLCIIYHVLLRYAYR